jgi:hypothetical protein
MWSRGHRRALAGLAGVTVTATILLGIGIERASVASPFSDPVGRIRAQDESGYASSAIHMAVDGGWLTPKVLGRYYLFKPPLLVWLSGLCLKLFGVSLWALRLPALASAVLAIVALWWWPLREKSALVAASAALLLLSNPLWHIFARLCYTDMLLVASITLALAILNWDPALTSERGFWGFAVSTASAVMAKNVAGLLPVAILMLYWPFVPRKDRPGLGRVAWVIAAIAVLVAPWHLYQLAVHTNWFWTDYVEQQLLGYGLKPAGQITEEPQVWFYARRLALTDPVLLLLTVIALPSLVMTLRSRKSHVAPLLGAWLAAALGALLIFRFRNLPYALGVLPPCALIAVHYGPFSTARRAKLGLAILCLAFVLKAVFPAQVWGLAFGRSEPIPAVAALRSYVNLGRANDLILVDGDDEFYASTLPLPSVRYYFFDPNQTILKFFPHYQYLGIVVTLDEFERLDQLRPVYAARLKAWGVDSTEPVATSIVSGFPEGIHRLIRACPHADFYLPARYLPAVDPFIGPTRRKVLLPGGQALLLADTPDAGIGPAAKWALPANW